MRGIIARLFYLNGEFQLELRSTIVSIPAIKQEKIYEDEDGYMLYGESAEGFAKFAWYNHDERENPSHGNGWSSNDEALFIRTGKKVVSAVFNNVSVCLTVPLARQFANEQNCELVEIRPGRFIFEPKHSRDYEEFKNKKKVLPMTAYLGR